MNKRILSLLIAIVMVVGLLPMAALAADPKVVITVETDPTVTTVNQGDEITYAVYVQSSINLTAIQLDELVVPAGMTYVEGSSTIADGLNATLGLSAVGGVATFDDGKIFIANDVAMTGITSKQKLGTFKVSAPKAGTYTVSIAKGANGTVFTDTYTDVEGDDLSIVGTAVTVNKTSYTASEVQLDYTGKTLAIENKNFSGTAAPTTWKVIDKDDAENPVEWPADELAKAEWSVDKNWAKVEAGTVSITDVAKAVAGDITVTVKIGGETKTATVAVTKAAAAPETVTVAGPTAAIIKADADQTYTFTATVKDQYGAEMAGQTIAWSTEPGTLPEGLTFADGVLTVSKDTPAASKGDVKIIATVGGKTGNITTKVTDIEFPGLADAVKVATTATYGDKWSQIVTIPATFAGKAGETTVNGTLTLKYDGEETPAAAEVGPAFQVIFNAEGFENVVAYEGNAPAIAKKTVTVKADDVRVDLKKELPTEWTYTIDGLVGTDELDETNATVTVNGGVDVDTSVKGEYPIVVSGVTDASGNYAIEFVDGTLTVKKKNTTPPAYGTGTTPDGEQKNPVDDPTTDEIIFDDVADDAWYHDDVYAAAKAGLMTGTADRTFAPNTTTTRAMIATILWRQAGKPQPRARIADFPDVVDGEWYADAVRWCAEREIVTGYDNGNFGPNDVITREQMVAMLYRYAGSPEVDAAMGMAGFEDVDAVAEYAADAMRWAVQNGIINGKDGAKLDPQGLATRAEVSAVINRFVALDK